jgi:hypothetical protein
MEVLQDLLDRAQNGSQEPASDTIAVQATQTPEGIVLGLAEAPLPPKNASRCAVCNFTKKGAERIADMRINDLFADELMKLPTESIVRAAELTSTHVLTIARSLAALTPKASDRGEQ